MAQQNGSYPCLRAGNPTFPHRPNRTPFQNRISSGLSFAMDHPAPSPRRCAARLRARPHPGAALARHCDPGGASLARRRGFGVASQGRRRRVGAGFSTFCVATMRQRCELCRRRVGMTLAGRPRARLCVTSPSAFCNGAAAGRGSDAVGLPSETVGEGNMPFLISSLGGEKFFTEHGPRARSGSACFLHGARASRSLPFGL